MSTNVNADEQGDPGYSILQVHESGLGTLWGSLGNVSIVDLNADAKM